MRKIMVSLLLVMGLALPAAIRAQDVTTDVPPTLESFPTVAAEPVTIEPQPTAVATEVPGPSPIDEAKIPTWLGVVAVVLVVGIISIAIVGIQKAAEGMPAWARELLLSTADSGLASLDTYTHTTETMIDDAAVAELHRLVDQLRAELNATKSQVTVVSNQVAQNTQDIAVTAQKVA